MLTDLGHSIRLGFSRSTTNSSRGDRGVARASRYTASTVFAELPRSRSSVRRLRAVARAVGLSTRRCAHPPSLLPGAAEAVAAIAARYRLGIVSDTGFASGRAQDDLLSRDGLRSLFEVTVYSVDIGHAKPRREPFNAALGALALSPNEVVHVGDNERTDVRGALDMGMRAIRVDFVRQATERGRVRAGASTSLQRIGRSGSIAMKKARAEATAGESRRE